jgi:UDP-3-O-[3-hydroxymyristoyl] glucosamine N-acyltransferase
MMTLSEIAAWVEGELRGDSETRITGIASIQTAKEGDISFLLSRNLVGLLAGCKASAAIVGQDVGATTLPISNLVVVRNPELAYAKVASLFEIKPILPRGISPGACVAPTATVANGAVVFPYAFVGDDAVIERDAVLFPFSYIGNRVHVGEGATIRSHVSVYEGSIIGKRVIIHSGAVIGSDGFRYAWDGKGQTKIPQLGIVVIEDDVEIGANTCIDRASLDVTIVKKGAKIDNLVQVAHNVSIGENSVMAAQVGIAGSTSIGSNVVLGGKVGVTGHVEIGDQVMAAGGTGITKSVAAKTIVAGNPHLPHREWLKMQAYLRRLPELFERVGKIEKKTRSGENED